MFKIGIKSELEFNEVMTIAESMGYHNGLEFKHIPHVKCLFLECDSKHVKWGHRNLDDYVDPSCKSVSIKELRKIATCHRIESSNCQIICWSCNQHMTSLQHSSNDGFCVHCNAEIEQAVTDHEYVEAVKKVNGFGGIGMAKLIEQSVFGESLDLSKAISDYEAANNESN